MTDRPINMRGPEVRALLDGRKTQHRVVLNHKVVDLSIAPRVEVDHPSWIQFIHPQGGPLTCVKWPYAPGDRLWVREAIDKVSEPGDVFYRADYEAAHGNSGAGLGWKPSIHMPRWASRLTLTVTEVRVQRLQEITEADAMAEGVIRISDTEFLPHERAGYWSRLASYAYGRLWEGLHGPGAWDANPWVAAITFTVQRGNIDGGAE